MHWPTTGISARRSSQKLPLNIRPGHSETLVAGNLWTLGVRQFIQASLRQLLATFPTGTSALRGRRSSEDPDMSIHAACLLLCREVLDAIANGWHEARDRNAFFSMSFYLGLNQEVKQARADSLAHFDRFSWQEGRQPFLLAGWAGALVDFLPYRFFFGGQRTMTQDRRRWHRLTVASNRICRAAGTRLMPGEILLTSIDWDGTRQGFDLTQQRLAA